MDLSGQDKAHVSQNHGRTTIQNNDNDHTTVNSPNEAHVLESWTNLTPTRSFDKRTTTLSSAGSDREATSAGSPIGRCQSNEDTQLVWWESEEDLQNPYNWPKWRKAMNCGLISAMTLISPLASSIFAPGVPSVMAEFGSKSLTLSSLVVSIYVLGFAFGPLLVAPLSEIYGRVVVYHASNIGFVVLCVGCALAPTLPSLIALRFFCGVFGCTTVTNGGGTIADMVRQEYRGAAMAAYSVGPILGPIIGPIVGGFLSEAAGWRWTCWLLAIIGGLLTVVMFLAISESYAPILLERRAAQLRKNTGNEHFRSKLDNGLSPRDHFARGIFRPLKLFIRSPIIIITSVYMAISYGYLYLMFTTMTQVFQDTYGFSMGTVGLAYLGLGVGSLIGVVYSSTASDRKIRAMAKAKRTSTSTEGPGSTVKPEYRLRALPIGALLVPIGLFIHGWTAQHRTHWIVPIISHIPIGIGNLMIFMSIQMYLVDAFTVHAASAIATNTVVRAVAGGLLPMAGLPMFETLGLGWGNSLLGFIALLTVPVAFLLLKYGQSLRISFPVNNL